MKRLGIVTLFLISVCWGGQPNYDFTMILEEGGTWTTNEFGTTTTVAAHVGPITPAYGADRFGRYLLVCDTKLLPGPHWARWHNNEVKLAYRIDTKVAKDEATCSATLLDEASYKSKTMLTSSPNPSQANRSVTFTATITPTPPNGEAVTFYNAEVRLGTDKTTNGIASFTTSFSAAKTYTIKASYPGDAFRKASSGTVKQVVSP